MRFHRSMISAAMVLATPALAAEPQTYQVALTIAENGQVVGKPTILVGAGTPASASVSNKYRADVVVSTVADASDQVALSTKIALPVDGALAPVASPSFTVRLGHAASVEMMAGQRPLRIEATVSPVPQ